MSDLAKLRVWDDPAIRGALSWYLDVAENRRPAKFRIARTVATQLDPAANSEDALWAELNRLTPIFVARWQGVRAGARLPPAVDGPSLLELCRELAYRMLRHCNFCPWNCHVDRMAGAKVGACKLASGSRVSSHFHHTGEELFYRGTQGSGTIFFTSCNMRCAFCQNGDISTDKDNGEETDPHTLAAMAWTLRREGCHNINWVGGEVVIHLHAIVDAIALLGRDRTPTTAELARARKTKADRYVMAQFHPDNFCDAAGGKYRDKYAEIARRPTPAELDDSWRRARELNLKFETATFERRSAFGRPAML
jgi:putative pyruvate formate lyase activating enzyme